MSLLMKYLGYYYVTSFQYDFLISFFQVMKEIFMWMTILLFLIYSFNMADEKLFDIFCFVCANFCIFYLFCEDLLHYNNQIFKVELWFLIFVLVTDLFGCFRGLFYIIKQLEFKKGCKKYKKHNQKK